MVAIAHLLGFLPTLIRATNPSDVLASPSRMDYDHVIIGGGPSGLVLANRLTEDPQTQVLVLEAGSAPLGDPLIDIPGFLGSTVGTASYDWLFRTVPQTHVNGNVFVMDRGKVLGGSTAINFMAYGRPAESEIDGVSYGSFSPVVGNASQRLRSWVTQGGLGKPCSSICGRPRRT